MRSTLGSLCLGLVLAASAAGQHPAPPGEVALCVRAPSDPEVSFRLRSEGGVRAAYAGSPSDVTGPTLRTPAMLILPGDRPFSLRLDAVRPARLVVFFCGSTELHPGSPAMLTGPKGSPTVEMVVDRPLVPSGSSGERVALAGPRRGR